MKQYEHYCKYCGKLLERNRFSSGRLEDFSAFKRRVYCNRKCMRMGFLKIGSFNQSYRNAHQTAIQIMNLLGVEKKCSKCGKTKNVDVHHKDTNYQNNNIDNLEYLCRSCHMKEHRKKGICKICGKPQKGYGYCNKHYIRFKKYGDPLYTKYKTKEGDDANE